MEDIRIGRRKIYRITTVNPAAATVPLPQLVGRDAFRTRLTITQGGATAFSLSISPNSGQGAFFEWQAGQPYPTFDVEEYGQLVTEAVFTYTTGAGVFRIIETILREE